MSEQFPYIPFSNPEQSQPQYKSTLFSMCQDVVLTPLKEGEEAFSYEQGYCMTHLDQD